MKKRVGLLIMLIVAAVIGVLAILFKPSPSELTVAAGNSWAQTRTKLQVIPTTLSSLVNLSGFSKNSKPAANLSSRSFFPNNAERAAAFRMASKKSLYVQPTEQAENSNQDSSVSGYGNAGSSLNQPGIYGEASNVNGAPSASAVVGGGAGAGQPGKMRAGRMTAVPR